MKLHLKSELKNKINNLITVRSNLKYTFYLLKKAYPKFAEVTARKKTTL